MTYLIDSDGTSPVLSYTDIDGNTAIDENTCSDEIFEDLED